MIDIILFYIILSSVFVFGKQTLAAGCPFFLSAVRLIPAGLILLTGAYIFDRERFSLKKSAFKSLLGLITFVFFMDVFRLCGLNYVSASYAALVNTLSPFIAALLAYKITGEPLTLKKLGAITLGVIAVIPLIAKTFTVCTECTTLQLFLGYSALLISTTSVVVRTFFLKDLVDVKKYPIYFILGLSFLAVGAVSLCCSLFFETWNPLPITPSIKLIKLIGFLLIAYSLCGQPLYAYLVKKYPITLITFFMLSTPIITAALNWFFYGYQIDMIFIFSCITLAVAFLLFYSEEKKEKVI